MSSEKKPQPVCLPDKFHQFAVTSSDYSRPFLVGCYPTLEAAVRAQGGKPEKWDVFVRYSTHEATIEALRAERDEARKDAHHWKANYEGLLSVADSRARALLSDGGRS